MSLFDVPGWNVPKDVLPASTSGSKKRKRPSAEGSSVDHKLKSAEINLEKLVKKLGDTSEAQSLAKQKNNRKKNKITDKRSRHDGEDDKCPPSAVAGSRLESSSTERLTSKAPERKLKADDTCLRSLSPRRAVQTHTEPSSFLGDGGSSRGLSKKSKGKKKEVRKSSAGSGAHDESRRQDSHLSNVHLTALQSKMKQSLDGARFRWINETLYKSSSQDAERLMREDPNVFEEYHSGFRHQVTSWPANPVDHFSQNLSSYPVHSVIVDLGCGDAALARNLLPKGHIVLSYDLVSANPYIVAADICDRIPLPGAEDSGTGQVVDVVVCSLSLMSTNWLNCLREARRVLKTGGELKIAEVASRFTNVDKFTSVVSSIGFRLIKKNDENTHFTLFEFKKTDGSRSLDEKTWQKILSLGDILQPCEYKRR